MTYVVLMWHWETIHSLTHGLHKNVYWTFENVDCDTGSAGDVVVERESRSESVCLHRDDDDETTAQTERLHDSVARQRAEIDDLRGKLQRRDAEIHRLKADVVSSPTLDAGDGGILADGGLLAAVQLDLQRATAER